MDGMTTLNDVVEQLLTPLSSTCSCAKRANAQRAEAITRIKAITTPRPKADYFMDLGPVIWWTFDAGGAFTPRLCTLDELIETTTAQQFEQFTHFTELLIPDGV